MKLAEAIAREIAPALGDGGEGWSIEDALPLANKILDVVRRYIATGTALSPTDITELFDGELP